MCEEDLQFGSPRIYSPRHSSNVVTLLPLTSPKSPWTLSSFQTPSAWILYSCVASLHRHEGNIFSIALSKGIVFTSSESNRIRAWSQPDCTDRGSIKVSSGEIRAILAHELQAANNTKIVSLAWRITTPRGFYTPAPTTKRLSWRVFDKKCIDSFLAQEGNVNAIVVNQDDGCVFTCSTAGSVKIWRRIYIETSHTLTMTLKFQDSPVNALALSSLTTNCFLYSANSDGSINFWEKEKVSGRHNHGGFLQGHRFGVLSLVAVEKLIFSGSEDTTIRVWRREEGSSFHECLAVLEGHRGPVRSLAACLEMEKVKGFLVYRASLDQSFKGVESEGYGGRREDVIGLFRAEY
ncbi:hypothetical protein Pint_02627 [Pistacia integerrima]|uniref:Uncharacterized protein n=1 Tax=Pistacia integerrima TaxID=434235 RepID=A0ACC0ZJP0_9ROSI|nr:hypothetical protein Pint_02627 [Pistacia integerrima]